jgi:DNA repair protein RadC
MEAPVSVLVFDLDPVAVERSDVLARLRAAGPGALDDIEVVQVLAELSAAQAGALVEAFGSLPEMFGADPIALCRLAPADGVDRLLLAGDLGRRLLQAPLARRSVLSSSSAVSDYLRLVLGGRPREQFRILFLDRRNRLIRDELMGQGSVDHAPVYPREVMRRALELNASAIVLAHNHPAGDPTPSAADIDMTRQIVDAARALRIAVHDHCVVAGDVVASFRTMGLL